MLMVNAEYFRAIKAAASSANFLKVTRVSEDQKEKQRNVELAVRFLVHTLIPYDGTLDVEEYIDDGIVQLAMRGESIPDASIVTQTFDLLAEAAGDNALRRYDGFDHTGKLGLVGLEGIAAGIGANLVEIKALKNPVKFVKEKLQKFWDAPEAGRFTSPGLRGTTRIQRTVPFGAQWFKP
jgi:hypothetical protein